MAIESLSADRSPTPDALLQEYGRQGASGVLEISHHGEDVSYAWFRGGRVYAMHVPGYRPALGIRLLSGGLISPEQLSAAAAEQRERFPTHLIGQVLVGMGLVSGDVIDGFVREQVLDQVADLLDLPVEDASFHPGRRIQQDIITPTDVDELLEIARQRRAHRCDVLAAVGGPTVVPALGPPGTGPAQTPLGPYDWALLCRVDGTRDITELARVCGFTVQEAAQIVADLALTGLLVIPPTPAVPDEPLAPVVTLHPDAPGEPTELAWQFDGTDVGEPEPVGDLLAEFSAFVHDEPVTAEPTPRDVPVDAAPEPPGPSTIDGGSGATPSATAVGAEAAEATPAGPVLELVVEAPEEPLPPDTTTLGGESPSPVSEPEPRGSASGSPFPAGAPVAPPAQEGYSDTSVFMRELSSLSDDPESDAPVVTRLVTPLTDQRRKRRFWDR